MSSKAILWIDETVDQYQNMRLPENWTIKFWKRWGGIATAMNWVFKNYPNASQYGWLADDCVPRTPGWDKLIEGAAGDWFLSYGQDRYVSVGPWRRLLHSGHDLGAPLCWGGELVRATGWWALPGVKQAGIDTAWAAIITHLRLAKYMPDVLCEHHNYRTGKREYDETDNWVKNGIPYIQNDIDTRDKWVASSDYMTTMLRIEAAMGGPMPR